MVQPSSSLQPQLMRHRPRKSLGTSYRSSQSTSSLSRNSTNLSARPQSHPSFSQTRGRNHLHGHGGYGRGRGLSHGHGHHGQHGQPNSAHLSTAGQHSHGHGHHGTTGRGQNVRSTQNNPQVTAATFDFDSDFGGFSASDLLALDTFALPKPDKNKTQTNEQNNQNIKPIANNNATTANSHQIKPASALPVASSSRPSSANSDPSSSSSHSTGPAIKSATGIGVGIQGVEGQPVHRLVASELVGLDDDIFANLDIEALVPKSSVSTAVSVSVKGSEQNKAKPALSYNSHDKAYNSDQSKNIMNPALSHNNNNNHSSLVVSATSASPPIPIPHTSVTGSMGVLAPSPSPTDSLAPTFIQSHKSAHEHHDIASTTGSDHTQVEIKSIQQPHQNNLNDQNSPNNPLSNLPSHQLQGQSGIGGIGERAVIAPQSDLIKARREVAELRLFSLSLFLRSHTSFS